jgi:hypothetical protein
MVARELKDAVAILKYRDQYERAYSRKSAGSGLHARRRAGNKNFVSALKIVLAMIDKRHASLCERNVVGKSLE